jgi:hypothetical protein
MPKELYVGIFEKSGGKRNEVDVSSWKKLDDCSWEEMPRIFGRVPQQVALLNPNREMLSADGWKIAVGEKSTQSWAYVTFDKNFVADCLRRDFVEKLELDSQTALIQIETWIGWISQKDEREIKAKVNIAITELQAEYVKVYGTPLAIDEAIKTLKVSQAALMRDYQSVAARV